MKKFIAAILIIISANAFSQKMLILPDTPRFANQNKGAWVLRLVDTSAWYSNGTRWVRSLNTNDLISGGSTDTTNLSNRINLKVNISDTTNMLINYLRSASIGYGLFGNGKVVTPLYVDSSSVNGLVSKTRLNSALNTKQDLLVSGANIKTINGNTLLGSGDITISGGGSTAVDSILIILAGESNGGGLAPNASATTWELAARDSVYILNNSSLLFEKLHIGTNNNIDVNGLNNTTHGLELGLSNLVNTQTTFFNNRLKIIKIAQGGATLSSWATNGTWFAKAKARIRSAKTQIDFSKYKVYIFLSLGINDAAGGTTTAAYKTGLVNHINDLRSEIGQGAIPTVITKFETIGGSMSSYNTAMGEIANENTNVFAIGTAGLGSVDANHWNYSAFKTIADSTIARFKTVVTYDNITTLPAAGQGITMNGATASIGNDQDDSVGIFTQNRYVKTGTYKIAYNGNGYGFSIDNQIFNAGVDGGTNWTAINPVGQSSYLKMIGYNSINLQSANLIEFAALKSNSNNVTKLQFKNGVNAFSTHNQESNFVGYNAGINENGSGYSNNALGSLALGDITSGQFNTGIGLQVLRYNTVGSHNISIGTLSGIRTDAGQHGSYNIFLGEYAASGSTAQGLDNFDSTLIIHSTTNYGSLQPLLRGKFSSVGQNKLGINLNDEAPASTLDINGANGYNQLRLRTQYTPTSTGDTNGSVGDIAVDDNFFYYKTTTGWKKMPLLPL